MKTMTLVGIVIAAAAGCGVVTAPGSATGGSDTGSGMEDGSGSGSGMGSGTGSGSDSGSGSGSTIPPNVMLGSIYDERNDVIDFASGQPVHTHTGAQTDLSTGCPAVYKYAYLMDQHAPQFGHENVANPLAWKIRSDSVNLDASATAYRVRDVNSNVLLDWTPMSADPQGVYHVTLYRSALAQLGTTVAKYSIDVRFRSNGVDTIKSACWEQHPIAAPLDFGAAEQDSLFTMSFASHSAISTMINLSNGSGVPVVRVPIVQQTSETTTLDVLLPDAPLGTGTKELVHEYVPSLQQSVSIDCGNTPCTGVTPPARMVLSAPISGQWLLFLMDDATQDFVPGFVALGNNNVRGTIPGRAANEPPHSYHAVLYLAGESSIAPPTPQLTTSSFADGMVNNAWMTYGVQSDSPVGCSLQKHNIPTNTYTCSQMTTYTHVVALNQAKIAFDALHFAFSTRAGDPTTEMNPPYVPSTATHFAGAWDAGNDGL
jgi:hypothetical protein